MLVPAPAKQKDNITALARLHKIMKNKKNIIFIIIIVAIFVVLPSFVLAQTQLTDPLKLIPPNATQAQKDAAIPTLIGRIISAVLGIVGSIALLMFIYGGFMWLTSGGITEKITKGKQVLVWAAIGLVVIFLSYTLVNFVIKGLASSSTTSGNDQTTIGTCKCTGGGGYYTQNTQSQCSAVISTYQPCTWSSQ